MSNRSLTGTQVFARTRSGTGACMTSSAVTVQVVLQTWKTRMVDQCRPMVMDEYDADLIRNALRWLSRSRPLR